MSTQARVTLDQARYFLAQANTCAAGNDWWACEANLLAAIQFGRNVTFQLKKELNGERCFPKWYALEQQRMGADPQMLFFRDSRNDIVHVRPPQVETKEKMRTHSPVLMLIVPVMQRDPPGRWFTWGPRTIFSVWFEHLTRPVGRLRGKLRVRSQARQNERLVGTTFRTEDLYFVHPIFGSKSARSLVREYLVKLAEVLSRSEEARGDGEGP